MKECPACKRCFPDDISHCPQDGDATTPSLLGEPILDARYQLERRLGQGGMGVVFQARHIFLKTSHAIKVILPDLVGNDPMLATRFRQEALAAAAIRHQNIIAVTDFGVVRGTMPFLVMEFVKGKSLQDIMAEEKVMGPQRALEFISAIGAGVTAAHRQKIVHRDLKPLNIMVQENLPVSEGLKILDFGLAKIKSGELLGSFVQAKTSGLMGSPFYMAPEQWSDEEPDARADVYSIGIILFQMLCGDVPFKGSSIPSIMKKHLTQPPPSFQSLGVQVPPTIEAVVRHALEKEIATRTPTVEDFLAELREAVQSNTATLKTYRQTGNLDPNQTVMSPLASVTSPGVESTDFNSLAGTISSTELDEEVQGQLSGSAAAQRLEQEQRERIAREEVAREDEYRRKVAEDAERQRGEDEQRSRREREERQERERQQREQMERVERQAKELEERLAKLAVSMQPQVTVADPEATQVRQAVVVEPPGNNSFPGAPALRESVPPLSSIAAKSSHTSVLMIVAGLVVLLLIGAGVGTYFLLATRPASSSSNGQVNPSGPATSTEANKAIKADLVEVPGGTFLMGRNDGPPQERPQHQATVKTFFMDRTEVTNAEYAEFVREANYSAPSHWVKGMPLPGQERWPVVNVSPIDAEAFAKWRSKRDAMSYRLPTEEEWEYAARGGGEYQAYPWGDRWLDKKAVIKQATPMPVGSFPEGANRWGVVDLIGNAWEWTSSKATLYPGNSVEIPAATRDWVVVRGGSYSSDPADRQIPISATYRDWFDPTLRHANFGFRLVRAP
ncbi:MAG TPA: SUMF1/EgtB/PvdO family nonheme iron enzyme [Pyrinomonadaceae bacterium]|nr:SUMF1/EgtB/PvdO family nonheme iron enzyme [Pyrinomonadaceae bacterium]